MKILIIPFCLMVVLIPVVATAHDLLGMLEERNQLHEDAAKHLEQFETRQRLLAATPTDGREGFIDGAYLWRTDSISVCFLDGSSSLVSSAIEASGDWLDHIGLIVEFNYVGNYDACRMFGADIRVSFSHKGNWSYIGLASLSQSDPSKPTLNIEYPRGAHELSNAGRSTFLHEFGHALGLHHEHQSPQSGCDNEFDWGYLYSWLGDQGWDKDKVDYNLKRLSIPTSRWGYFVSDFDKDSIMLYALPRSAFKDSSKAVCYVERKALRPSRNDLRVLQSAYPRNP